MKIYYVRHQAMSATAEAAGAVSGALGAASGGISAGLGATFHALTRLSALATRYAIGVPVGMGLTLGMLSSKLTSPGAEDVKLTEKRLEMARVRAMTAENRRRIETERKRRKQYGTMD